MPHFRLQKADAIDDEETLYCDEPDIDSALANFGHKLDAKLVLDGDAIDFVLQSRTYDEPNFNKSERHIVSIVRQ